jgi:hypothetical protein
MTSAPRIFILIALGLSAALAFGQATPTVYVTTSKKDHLSSQKRRELADSARDVREQLAKRDGVETVDDRDDADVLITILDRRIEVNESGTNDWGGALQQTHYQSRHIVFFRFESQSAIEESEIALAGAFVTWKRVAGVLAKDAEEWALHRARN